jgi:hypothetical protein
VRPFDLQEIPCFSVAEEEDAVTGEEDAVSDAALCMCICVNDDVTI